jgi:metal-responsive CopG/Arc/MetJ family transcriptional regulator
MNTAKITISVRPDLLRNLDRLVQSKVFPSRSHAFQEAVEEKLVRMQKSRLAEECAKLDPTEEQAFADIGLHYELDQWPEY